MQHSLSSLASLVLVATCLAQPNWVQVNTQNTPTGRWSHGMAYDLIRSQTVIFGGTSASNSYMNDTWVYDGSNWTQASPTTVPPGRRLVSLALHLTRVRMVMFGGLGGAGVLGDTWEWDGNNWTQLNPQRSPTPRRSAAMA